jgi:hypothetical protein
LEWENIEKLAQFKIMSGGRRPPLFSKANIRFFELLQEIMWKVFYSNRLSLTVEQWTSTTGKQRICGCFGC